MELVCPTEIIMTDPSPECSGSRLTDTSDSARTFSTEPSVNLTVHSQNGQYIIHQPLKTVNSGPVLVSNGTALSKGHIVVKQKLMPTYQQTQLSSAAVCVGDKTTVETSGVKRPLTSSDNVITKVFIKKNAMSGNTEAFSIGQSSQAFTFASLPVGGNLKIGSNGSQQQSSSSLAQPTALTKTMTLTSQGILTPVNTVITSSPNTGTPKVNFPYFTMPSSPGKTPAKTVMISLSGSPHKQSMNPNITVISRALDVISHSGSMPLKSASKVIIRQGFNPTGLSSFTLKGQSLQTLAPQTVKTSHVFQSMRAPQTTQSVQPIRAGSAGPVQQIQVPGSRFPYVRLVSSTSADTTMPAAVLNARDITQVVQSPRNVPLTVAPSNASQIKITLPFQQHNVPLAPKPASVSMQQGMHHFILPATSSAASAQGSSPMTTLVPIQPAPSVPAAAVHNGTAILSTTNSSMQGLQSFALVPASYVTQLQQQVNKSQTVTQAATPSVQRQARDYVPIASIDPAVTQYTVSRNVPNLNGPYLEEIGARPRKPCNCTKSQCLKLYCDCFANGEFCQNCNCTCCANNLEHEEERSKAIKSCLDRNPQAFHPKIGKSKEVEGSRRHNKGCNCKKSGCLKNYCECYEAKIMCSHYCKCIGCKNFEESSERKTLMHLADAAEVRVQQQTSAKTKLSSQISSVPARPQPAAANGERLPFAFITADVAEATSACLLAQAQEAERMKMPPVVQERMIIEEFGRCLMQIIESANRTRNQ